jgi:hypothetical protein
MVSGGAVTMGFLNVFLFVGIILVVLLGLSYQRSQTICEQNPSDLCYNIHCPCDNVNSGPCFGFAQRQVGPDSFICINAPLTIVDGNGKPK